jgi:hypothetical protein
MAPQQHVDEKSPPRRCGARRIISTTKSRLVPAPLHPEWTPLRGHAAVESRVKSTEQPAPRVAGDNGFTSGARR